MSAWGSSPFVALHAIAAIELDDRAGCVTSKELDDALMEIGGIDDLTERISVRIEPSASGDDSLTIVATLGLARAPNEIRQATFIPHECVDVPALVAVWAAAQRRHAQRAPLALRPAPRTPAPPRDARARKHGVVLDEGWTACSGPADCGGPRVTFAGGPTLGFDPDGLSWASARLQIDASTRLTDSVHVQGVAALDGTADAAAPVVELGPGVAATAPLGPLEASLHGSFSLGLTSCAAKSDACIFQGSGATSTSVSLVAVPRAAARVRFGYGFVEIGATAHVGSASPLGAYALVGFSPFR